MSVGCMNIEVNAFSVGKNDRSFNYLTEKAGFVFHVIFEIDLER